MKETILYVDDEPQNTNGFKYSFMNDYEILTANSVTDGLKILDEQKVKVVISDHRMPNKTGVEFFELLSKIHPSTVKILLTAYTEVNIIMDAINKGGVFQYITKPWNRNQVKLIIDNAIEKYNFSDAKDLLVNELKTANDKLINSEKKIQKINSELTDTNKSLILTNEELKKSYDKLEIAKEKEILLKEIHHRVKNNLQIISSLISLQQRQTNNPEVLDTFKQCQHRIRSMAMIHEQLYQSKNFSKIKAKEYLLDLTSNICKAYLLSPSVTLSVTADEAELDISTVVPLGLITNEVITNSAKYAFNENSVGEIFIHLRKTDENSYEIEMGDTGVGLPEDLDWKNSNSMGLQLIHILTGQLDGKIVHDKSFNGTKFVLSFTVKES